MEHEKDNLKQEAETTKPEEAKTAAAEEAAPEEGTRFQKENGNFQWKKGFSS